MTGFPLIIAFIVAIVFMIVAISKFKIHPFLSIMGVSLILGLVAGIPAGRPDRIGRNCYQWSGNSDLEPDFPVHSPVLASLLFLEH